MNYYDQIQEAAQYIAKTIKTKPKLGLILGTGLGGIQDGFQQLHVIDYASIPHFPTTTVESHSGKMIFGIINEMPIVILSGRFHYYEGYSMQEVTFPIRVLAALGVETLILTNVSGSVNKKLKAGDIVVIKDHINLMPENPLRGTNDERMGPRFPDMIEAYDKSLIKIAKKIANQNGIKLPKCVYLSLQGPNLETPAEYKFAHKIGADLIGMSTVPEVIVARHSGIKVLAFSLVSNQCYPFDKIKKTTIEAVIKVASRSEPIFAKIILGVMDELSKS
jgi:purine-nucleoside phosphorylase